MLVKQEQSRNKCEASTSGFTSVLCLEFNEQEPTQLTLLAQPTTGDALGLGPWSPLPGPRGKVGDPTGSDEFLADWPPQNQRSGFACYGFARTPWAMGFGFQVRLLGLPGYFRRFRTCLAKLVQQPGRSRWSPQVSAVDAGADRHGCRSMMVDG